MNRPATVLPQIDGVAVGFEDVVLAVARVDQNRHEDFVDLAREGPFIAQKQILDQLLGQGAATLHRSPGAQVGQHGAENTLGIDAGVLEKRAILDRQQGIHQGRRQILALEQDAIFIVRGVDAGDLRRVQTQ